MIYTNAELRTKFRDYANPMAKVANMAKSRKIIRVTHGLYVDDPNIDPLFLSSYIYGPSYVSFETALSMYGLIPEQAVAITCATCGKSKKKVYETPFGAYIYRDVPWKAFPEYTSLVNGEGGIGYLIATREKAVCDKLYTIRSVKTNKGFIELLFDDLRFDHEGIMSLDIKALEELSPLYRSPNVRMLLEYRKGELADEHGFEVAD